MARESTKTGNSNKRIALVAIIGAIIIALIAVYGSLDPESPYFPKCSFKALTGYDCPGCGSQRAFHALLNGRFGDAWHYNGFMLLLIPVIALALAADALRNKHPRLQRIVASPPVIAMLILSIIIWTILRNIL